MDDISLIDLISSLRIKNQLIAAESDKIIDYYTKNENFLSFLDIIEKTLKIDCIFLLFDMNMINTIINILNIKRFDYKDEETVEKINNVIRLLNGLINMPISDKKKYKYDYLDFQSDVRGFRIKTDGEILNLIIYDILVYDALLKSDFSKLNDCKMFLSSILFLLSYIPYIFLDDGIRNNVYKVIDDIDNGKYHLDDDDKKYFKKFVKKFSDIKILL